MLSFMRMKILLILRNPKKSKFTVEGVSDLTLTFLYSDFATNIEEMQIENYGDDPVGVDGDDAIDTKGVKQGEEPIPLEMDLRL